MSWCLLAHFLLNIFIKLKIVPDADSFSNNREHCWEQMFFSPRVCHSTLHYRYFCLQEICLSSPSLWCPQALPSIVSVHCVLVFCLKLLAHIFGSFTLAVQTKSIPEQIQKWAFLRQKSGQFQGWTDFWIFLWFCLLINHIYRAKK